MRDYVRYAKTPGPIEMVKDVGFVGHITTNQIAAQLEQRGATALHVGTVGVITIEGTAIKDQGIP